MHMKKVTKKDRYGNSVTVEYEASEKPFDYNKMFSDMLSQQGEVPEPMAPPVMGEEFNMGDPMNHPGEPRGEDTVPAWLTPGEFVVNAEATEMYGPEIEAMNNHGREVQAMKRGGYAQYANLGYAVLPNPHLSAAPAAQAGFGAGLGRADNSTSQADLMAQAYQTQVPNQIWDKGWYGFGRGFRDLTDEERREREEMARRQREMATDYFVGSAEAGMLNDGGAVPIPYDQALLEAREGFKDEIYLDSLGKPTIGHGHLIENKVWDENDPRIGTQPYTKEEMDSMFQDDIATARAAARRNAAEYGVDFDSLDRRQQAALVSQAFQLGETGQKGFKKMWGAMADGDYEGVRREAADSAWATQTPTRLADLQEAFMNVGGTVPAPFIAAPLMFEPQYRFDGGYLTEQLKYGWNEAEGRPYTREEAIAAGTIMPDGQTVDEAMEGFTDDRPDDLFPPGVVDTPPNMRPDMIDSQPGMAPPMYGETNHPMGSVPTPAIPDPNMRPDALIGSQPGMEDPAMVEMSEMEQMNRQADILADESRRQANQTGVPMMESDIPHPMGSGNQAGLAPPIDPNMARQGYQSSSGPNYQEMARREVGEETWANASDQDRAMWTDMMEQRQRGRSQSRNEQRNRVDGLRETVERMDAKLQAGEPVNEKTLEKARRDLAREEANLEAMNNIDDVGLEDVSGSGTKTDQPYKERTQDFMTEEGEASIQALLDGAALGDTPDFDPRTPEGDAEIDQILKDADKATKERLENEGKNTIKSAFAGAFAELFNPQELARMAILYAGSRLMGYSHGGSLQWATGQYLNRLDAQQQAKIKQQATTQQQAATLASTGKYTPESLGQFQKTGDLGVLKPVAGTAKPLELTSMKVHVPGEGVRQVWKMGDAQYYKNSAGQTVPVNGSGARVYDEGTMGQAAVKRDFAEGVSSKLGEINHGVTEDKDEYVKVDQKRVTDEAARIYRNYIKGSKLPVDGSEELKFQINGAIGDYMTAVQAAQAAGEPVPKSLNPYFEARMLAIDTNLNPSLLVGVSTKNKTQLNNRIKAELRADGLSDEEIGQNYAGYWQAAQSAWGAVPLDKQKSYQKSAGEGKNGFTYFFEQLLKKDEEALKYARSVGFDV